MAELPAGMQSQSLAAKCGSSAVQDAVQKTSVKNNDMIPLELLRVFYKL